MKNKLITTTLILVTLALNAQNWNPTGDNTTSGDIVLQNPQNTSAVSILSWQNDIARIRIGGMGAGASNGFMFQGVADANLFRIMGNGNVGIGTSSPNSRLELKAGGQSIKFLTGINSSGYSLDIGVNDDGINFNNNSTIRGFNFKNARGKLMSILSNGNIGIGTNDPKEKLEILGAALINTTGTRGSSILKLDRGTEGKDAAVVSFGQNSNYTWHTGLLYNAGSPTPNFYISQNNAIRDGNGNHVHTPELTINETGRVGIGTMTPQAKLEVRGDALINTTGTRGSSILKLDRGTEGKDAAVVSFGQNSNYTWHTGLLYNGGGLTPNFYISQNNQIRDGNGTHIHTPEFTINGSGNIGIGTTRPDSKLTVKGKIHAEEVKIDLSVPAPDYVFKKDYELLTLEQVQEHIVEKGHLPNIPSAEILETEGVELGAMNMKLLEKIEELTLYTIEQQKEIQELKSYKNKIKELEKKMNLLLKSK